MNLNKKRELEKKAIKHGYHGLFATPETLQVAKDYIDRARRMGDTIGLMVGLGMLQNYKAITKAKQES